MKITSLATLSFLTLLLTATNCIGNIPLDSTQSYPYTEAAFSGKINLNSLANYAAQKIPAYITKSNSTNNPITNAGATLGRVLFYDQNLSSNNAISCASCHQQANAFGDTAVASTGVHGTTGRHTPRLVNAGFGQEAKFFWDERAATLEAQSTMPIRNHTEMGFSGANGDGDFNAVIAKLSSIGYYRELFKFVYGNEEITENKMQLALAQFVRSISSFDAKYDTGRASAQNNNRDFANFTTEENLGKTLFLQAPVFSGSSRVGGGLGCGGCHRAPEFDIDANSANNGITGSFNGSVDLTNTRSPSLRDLVKTDGNLNGPLMHDGSRTTLLTMIEHYNSISAVNNVFLDNRLKPAGSGQNLNMATAEKNALIAFLKTLAGSNVYIDPKWSNPYP